MSDNTTNCSIPGNDFLILPYLGLPLSCLVACESVLTIVTILRTRALHESQYLFIVSLALMDVLTAVACTASTFIYLPSIQLYFRSKYVVIITAGVSTASISVTGVHMSFIAIDRYIRIAHPFYHIQKMTKQRIIKMLICAWLVWLLMSCVPLVISTGTNYWKCLYTYLTFEYFLTNSAIILVSVGIVCVGYFNIARIAVRHRKSTLGRRLDNGGNSSNNFKKSNNIALKSVRFFVIMFGVYFVCAASPLIAAGIKTRYNFSEMVLLLLSYFFPINSVLNYIILCFMDKRFLRALRAGLAGVCVHCCRK